jgi:hypothetical protein
MADRIITPADETSMTIEAHGDLEILITVERGNGHDVQTMDLTTQEWLSLIGMLGTFHGNYAPAVHVTFKALAVRRYHP